VTPRGRALAVASVGTWWEQQGRGERAEPLSEMSRLRAMVEKLQQEIARLRAGGEGGSHNEREQTGSKIAESGAPGRAR